ncbi:oligosaccharide flippase family protein [Paenibacillus sp. P32E]|uniref:oligosaccharide flippase family protein n=1 Tax=Paenibacillus sp. P32E TaxID=1349434 RepID=UPI00093CBD9F|nr:oligosaccharide flippase family protein [Paenibacillus sp. P32E]OKP87582.1 sugar translocase [Paenibacillus sp. P32E]
MITRKILKNAFYLFFGNISVRVILAIVTILFARNIGPDEYGIFAVAIAFSNIVAYFTDSGLTNTFMREATKEKANITKLISSYFRVRLVLALLAIVFSYFFINSFYSDPNIIKIINLIVYPTIIGVALQGVGTVFFQANERMQFSAAIMVTQGVTTSLSIFLGIILKVPLTQVAIMYGCSSLVTGFVSIILVLRYTSLHKGWDKSILINLLSFTINGIIIIMLPQLGPIILEKVSTLSEVGLFSTAYRIPSVLYQIPGIIAIAFYPRLFTYGNDGDYQNHRSLSKFELKLMSFIGMLIGLPFVLNSEYWIVALLGGEWIKSSAALSILSFMIILQSINYPLADYLTTIGHQSKRTLVMAIGLLVAILGYLIMGFYYGMLGAAFTAILTETTLLIGFCIFIKNGLSFFISGVKFNLFSFIICISIYYFLPKDRPLIFLSLTMIFFVLLVILLDQQIRQIIKDKIVVKFKHFQKSKSE